jgi:Ca2+-binding EF-hand superfamily protein
VSQLSEGGGASAASTKEPSEEALPSGLVLQAEGANVLRQAVARSAHTSTDPDKQGQAMKEICRLRREMMIPLESMQAAMKLFREHATVPADGVLFADGVLTKANLASVMRQLAGSHNSEFESSWVDSAFKLADKDRDGSISFQEFAIWFSSRSFDEDLNLDGKELELRKLSRTLDMAASDIEKYKRHFDSFDTDGNGTMCREEFYDMMLKCLKIPKHIGLPAVRVQQLWSAADSDGSGSIDFSEFAAFFSKYFPQGGACGMDQYYSQNSLLNVLHGTYKAW